MTSQSRRQVDTRVSGSSIGSRQSSIDTQAQCQPSEPQVDGHSFTARGVAVGLLVGLVICFSNMYFGLQTGWVSTMTMPSSLLGFGMFRLIREHLKFPFSPVENVLVQTVAGSMAIMPLGCGFVGVIPAMTYLLDPTEQGPISFSLPQLLIWSLGLCYFGVVFAVPLRKQVIIREKLRFPSGFSTAVLIGVLHGKHRPPSDIREPSEATSGGFASLAPRNAALDHGDAANDYPGERAHSDDEMAPLISSSSPGVSPTDWTASLKGLLLSFLLSGTYTLCTFFLPFLRSLPIFGSAADRLWLWNLNPSPAYVGQGIIMGPETTLHMLLGAFIGWGILSPLAKLSGWAPGPVSDWETGSKGWIVWVSLAIMLADAVVSLGFLAIQTLSGRRSGSVTVHWSRIPFFGQRPRSREGRQCSYSAIPAQVVEEDGHSSTQAVSGQQTYSGGAMPQDAPPEQQVGNRTVAIGLFASIVLCVGTVHAVFGDLVPLYANIAAVAVALLLSIMGVRALGETDLNPVSGISKLAQLFFALIIPQSYKSIVLINLVAGAVSEAGALQAGELMQDLKTGHLLGAAPRAQFWGQVIGATAGAITSAFIYKIYTTVYTIPGDLFPVPTGYVWIFTARLVTGKGLPPMAKEWALAFAVVFAILTLARAVVTMETVDPRIKGWIPKKSLLPGGIAVAVGMYNVPSFTLARAIGGLFSWYWGRRGGANTSLIVLASGCILGEGVVSIVNLLLQSLNVPHLP
ncbi:OPT oligopeptide transporter [Plectosphaerella plurivora]|uniref:OPT oligopeptide transporter n=1 Tax=Plectosphaerella plurivora TaxID=936078 RepID=A0A9P8V5A1_9PEZI|nr:OPT oligopeptide transporter [Plectosphaerella plurivora]